MSSQADPGQVTLLLEAWGRGERKAFEELAPSVYRELRRLSASFLRRERPHHTLQPTALVHEAYLLLVDQTRIPAETRAQFFAIAANLMRQILVRHARRRRALKRGSGNKVELETASGASPPEQLDLVILDEVLRKLADIDPRQARIVELRFFGGLTEEEIAREVGVSVATVKREWRIARATLYDEMSRSLPEKKGRHDARAV